MFFFWDYHLLTAAGRDVVFVSHNECDWFASREVSVADSVKQQLKDALGVDSSSHTV